MQNPTQQEYQHTGMMQTALQFINSTGRHIFLTGKAGTGKTTFLRSLQANTHKQLAIVAPTGIAALNAGGTTIHSQFLLPFGMFIPDRHYSEPPQEGANWYTESVLAKRHPLNSTRRQVLRSIDLLIIDEVSMLRADLLDAIDYRLRSARNNPQGFGGVQLLLIGDLYQLPPVVKREEESKLLQFYRSPWFFESKALYRDGFTYIELDRIFRQSDNEFIHVLNNLRVNRPTAADLDFLNRYYRTSEEIQNMREVITLTTHNYRADEMNLKALRELSTESHFFDARLTDEFPDSMFPVLPRIELKVGAQIMFTRNDSEEGVYYNGKLATVTAIQGKDVTVLLAGSDKHYTLKRAVWENKKYRVNPDTKELEEDVVGTFEQFPVRLAWAITVHKSQGLTFDKAIIDVGQAFADGQVYVALSRLRSIDGLVLRTRVDPSIVSADRQIVSFDEQNNRPDVLDTEIKAQQKEYLYRQFNKTFDFGDLLNELQRVARGENTDASFDEKSMKPVLRQLRETLISETANTHKFRDQLRSLLGTGKHEEFIQRLGKGREYYMNLLWTQLKQLLQHTEEMRHQKRVQQYLTHLGDLDHLFSKKLEEVDKVSHLAHGILEGRTYFDFSELNAARKALRESLLMEATTTAPKDKKKSRKKSGLHTSEISIQMAQNGMTVAEIAAERGLVAGTIETHLTKGVESGKISIFSFMKETDVEMITDVLKQMPEVFSSSDVYSRLNGKFTYGQLRAVMSHCGIKSSKKSTEDHPEK